MARPILAAVAQQQKKIDQLEAQNQFLYRAVNKLATVAGLRVTADGDPDWKGQQYRGDVADGPTSYSDAADNGSRKSDDDGDSDADEQKEARRRRANAARRANFRRQADEKNPAQPIPDPGSEAPYSTSDQARNSGTKGDVSQIGGVPGATNVGADATDTVDSIGGIDADSGYNINEDVTKPISGTEGPIPLADVRTLPNIEFGNPLKPEIAFPLEGEWANKATLGSQARTYASLRLARLRMEAGIADPQGDDLILGQSIQVDSKITDGAIYNEIETLTKVIAVRTPTRTASRKVANVERTTPSFSPGAAVLGNLSDNSDDGAFLFE